MDIFISLVVFGMAIFLFFMTTNKIKNIKSNIIIDDARKEIEGLIAEFNNAAARNIEILESRISDLQDLMKKAGDKMISMDEKIERMNKPIVVEKIVEKQAVPKKNPVPKVKTQPVKPLKTAVPDPETAEKIDKPFIIPLNEMNRSDKLKYLLKTGKTKEELIGMGFLENEINLVSFLMNKGT